MRVDKSINIDNYSIVEIREVEPNVYLVVCKKGRDNKIKEPIFKCFIINETKDEQSASVRQISLPFGDDIKTKEMEKKYPYCLTYFIDLG